MSKQFVFLAVAVSLLLVSGCVFIAGNSVEPDKFGFSKEAYRVGGGFTISYVAPEDGTILLIDRKSVV
jgi:hypothetical protein